MNFFINLFKPKCPYCREVLVKQPRAKTQCPHCKKYIFVRDGKALTEHNTQVVDTNRKFTTLYGVSLERIETERKRLEKKFGFRPNESDVRWGLFNWLIIYTRDNGVRSRIYSDMAEHINKEGKDGLKILQLAAKFNLKNLEDNGIIEKVEILTDPEACGECKKFNGQRFDINAALKQQLIPNKKCKTKWNNGQLGFCRCMYQAVIDDKNIEELASKIIKQDENMTTTF